MITGNGSCIHLSNITIGYTDVDYFYILIIVYPSPAVTLKAKKSEKKEKEKEKDKKGKKKKDEKHHLWKPNAIGDAMAGLLGGGAMGGGGGERGETQCELCWGMFPHPVTYHMRHAHPGCGRHAGGKGYKL